MTLKCYKLRGSNTMIYLLEIEEDIYYFSFYIKCLIKEYKRNGVKYKFKNLALNELDLINEKEYDTINELEFDYLEELI